MYSLQVYTKLSFAITQNSREYLCVKKAFKIWHNIIIDPLPRPLQGDPPEK